MSSKGEETSFFFYNFKHIRYNVSTASNEFSGREAPFGFWTWGYVPSVQGDSVLVVRLGNHITAPRF
jgi:hypothetical protein